jgi:transaldolase
MSVADQKTVTQLNQLEQIKRFTTVVADTADFESIRQFKPQDAARVKPARNQPFLLKERPRANKRTIAEWFPRSRGGESHEPSEYLA